MGAMDKTSMTLNNHDGVKNQAVHQNFYGRLALGMAATQSRNWRAIRATRPTDMIMDEVVRPLVRDEYREKYHVFGGSGHGWHWLRSELEQLLQDSILLSAQERQVTIFVDELDGVGAQFASEITAYFHRVGDSVAAKMVDITTYVNDRLDVEHLGVPEIQGEIHGLIYNPISLHRALQYVPHGLSDVYQGILKNTIKREYRSQSLLLFQWVCHDGRPLSVTEMRYALAATDTAQKLHSIRCQRTGDFAQTDDQIKQRIHAFIWRVDRGCEGA
ncbi:hypothetical protein CA14_008205 [Aspergillus flavus]|uniref:Uncharacterized protein n=1 Tax=Aspergillus flavus TaxID=5059 RepID=A0AB74CK63_ASPFL|nr:hypothetical protein CA14_008205 [Aspergillus flavus]